LTTDPQSGPKITPFMIASASVTENGADATTVKSSTANGYATHGPIVELLDGRLLTNHERGKRERGKEDERRLGPT
jgi:hypothetical protein